MTKQLPSTCPIAPLQQWFGGIITQRLDANQCIQAKAPSGFLIAEEAARYIVPSPTLSPHERLQIYNQQYWWRLLNTLHMNFPLVARLFGYQAFNEKVGIPFLLKYPPNHWSMYALGERLPQWTQEFYKEPDRTLIQHAAALDWAFTASFLAPHHPPLDLTPLTQGNPDDLLERSLYLQPHMHLFSWNYDLFNFRHAFLEKEIDYWTEHRFPSLQKGKTYRFVLFRTLKNTIAWREASAGEYTLLEQFRKGSTLTEVCERIEQQKGALYEEMTTHFQEWLQTWASSHWLTENSSKVCPE